MVDTLGRGLVNPNIVTCDIPYDLRPYWRSKYARNIYHTVYNFPRSRNNTKMFDKLKAYLARTKIGLPIAERIK